MPLRDKTDLKGEMQSLWDTVSTEVGLARETGNLYDILDTDWCQRGKGGLVCLVLGMKWWRASLTTTEKNKLEVWAALLRDMTAVFQLITEAKSMYVIIFDTLSGSLLI